MAEIAGVAATAAQLAVTCFSLLDLMKKIKAGSSTLKRYHQQLQELRSLSDSVSKNPLLQTPEIGDQTQTILSIIEDNYLSSLLQKSRWLRTWGLIYRERDIIDVFTVLERQKTTLSLAIEEIQSRALHQIQSDICMMASKSSKPSRRSKPKQHTNQTRDRKGKAPSRSPVSPVSTTLARRENRIAELEDSDINEEGGPSSSKAYIHGSSARGQSMNGTPLPSDFGQDSDLRLEFNDCVAGHQFHQILGPYVQLHHPQDKSHTSGPIKAAYKYNNCIKYGEGDQVNGPELVDYGGGYTVDDLPKIDGQWNNCSSRAGKSKVSGILGTQYVGGRFRRAGYHPDDEPKSSQN